MYSNQPAAQTVIVGTMKIVLTAHAIARYAQRLLGIFNDPAAAEEFAKKTAPSGTLENNAPLWTDGDSDADVWLVIGPDCAFPCVAVRRGGDVYLVAKTVLTRGGFRRSRRPGTTSRGTSGSRRERRHVQRSNGSRQNKRSAAYSRRSKYSDELL